MMKTSDQIRAKPRGTADQAFAYLKQAGAKRLDFLHEYIDELYRLGNEFTVDAAILVAQGSHETAKFQSPLWVNTGNPAGLGAFDDGTYVGGVYPSGTVAAQAQFAHMLAYLGIDAPADLAAKDPRYTAVRPAGFWGAVKTIGNLGRGKWATDDNYAAKVVEHGNAIYPNLPDSQPVTQPPTEVPPMSIPDGWKLYEVAGLSKKIALPVPLIIDLIPTYQTNQRPGIRRQTPGYWVQHETGNPSPGANAAMHNRYLHNGAGGAQTSFHFTTDDRVIYQMIPIDEVTWQAADGGGPGNMSGISNELCINQGINHGKARNNAEALAAGVLGALGLGADRVKRHWDFNYANDPSQRHHCPDLMMNAGYWPTFVANVGKLLEGPAQPQPDPTPEPEPVPEEKHQLPDWMTPQLANRLFGSYVAPWGDDGKTVYKFDISKAPSQVWVARGKKSGLWPELSTVIRRGDGSELWVWSNGESYPRKKDAA